MTTIVEKKYTLRVPPVVTVIEVTGENIEEIARTKFPKSTLLSGTWNGIPAMFGSENGAAMFKVGDHLIFDDRGRWQDSHKTAEGVAAKYREVEA